MNYKIYGIAIILMLSCVGCYSVKVNNANMHTSTTNPIALGVIGVQKTDVLSSDFKVSAIPEYQQQIRVAVKSVDFNATTFDTYLKVSKENKLGVTYIDSVDRKPKFVILDLLDRVGTTNELQSEHNIQTITYLKSQKNASMVTSVSMALPEALLQEITDAEAVFLSNRAYKQYQLSLVKGGKPYKTIDFAEVTIFAYKLSFFCWSENERRQITLASIIDEKSSCPKNAYRDAQKALEKMNYFKL